MLGETSLEVATTWLNLGAVLRAAGKLDEAESACRQCLDIRERQLGSQHTDTAAAQIGKLTTAFACLAGSMHTGSVDAFIAQKTACLLPGKVCCSLRVI